MNYKFKILIIVFFSLLNFTGCGNDIIINKTDDTQIMDITENILEVNSESTEPIVVKDEYIYVYICGEIKNPDVYKMKLGDRVVDVIKKAGGFTKNANIKLINQAKCLEDEQQVYIPSIEEDEISFQQDLEINTTNKNNNLINLNTATKDELMTIPSIGESKAIAIIDYRENIKKFESIDEIKNISGIKDGIFNKIKDFIII